MELSRTDIAILSEMMNQTSVHIAAALDVDINQVDCFLEKLSKTIMEINEQSGNIIFAIELFKSIESRMKLTARDIIDCRQAGRECIKLDIDHNFLPNSDITTADQVVISNYSAEFHKVILRIEGTMLQTYINGVFKVRLDFLSPRASEPRLSRYARAASSYQRLLQDHEQIQLPKEMHVIWHDRVNRVLVADRKTERVLHNSLLSWLEANVFDGRVRAEVSSISLDRTDIEIQTFNGEIYVFEVKWLGVNAAKKRYGEERIHEGMDQIYAYLKRDAMATKGILVCYDGRTQEEHQYNSKLDPSRKHIKGDYYVLYIPSETASADRR